MSSPSRVRSIRSTVCLVSSLAWLLTASCSLSGYDYLKEGSKSSGGVDGNSGGAGATDGGATDPGSTTSRGGATFGGSTSGSQPNPGGSTGAGGTTTVSTTEPAPIPFGPWEFDAPTGLLDWAVNSTKIDFMTMAWTEQGEADPKGAMLVTVTALSELGASIPQSDLREYRVNFRVRTESGTAAVKPHAFSAGYTWADNADHPVSSAWSTVTLPFLNPVYIGTGNDGVDYSGDKVVNFGIQVNPLGTTIVLWVDRVWLERI